MILSLGFLGGWLGAKSYDRQTGITNPSQAAQIVTNESEVISGIAKKVGESVVSINVVSTRTQSDFFGFERPVTQQSAGTGFIISSDGVIATNRHVVPSNNSQISVTLSDGTELTDIEILGRTSSRDPLDVAFLKIKNTEGKELKPVELGNSSDMEVGDMVIAIGNALGQFQNTVTTGIISGHGRSIVAEDEEGLDTLQDLFQTDAAINQGNSGGPLVNIHGKVIGINTAAAIGRAQNIGFAIPIDDVKGLISSVLETGKIERPYLGVRYVQLNPSYANEFNLDVEKGAYLAPSRQGPTILPDSPAEKAGLKEKDIILRVNGQEIVQGRSLASLIGRHKVGDEVTLTIIRDGKEQTIKVKLEASPQ